MPLDTFEQDVLAQALNEALTEQYRSHLIPLSAPAADDAWDDGPLRQLMDRLLENPSPAPRPGSEPPTGQDC